MKEYFLTCNQYNIAVYESGAGNIPLVLLHGGGVDSAMLSWREVMSAMPEQYTIYAIDLLGYGKSDRPEGMEGKSFYEKHISALESIVDKLHLDKFVLSGLSMGGAISIGYALKNPDKVIALIPVDSWGLVSKMPMHGFYYWYVNTSLLKTSYRLFAKYRWMVKWSLKYSLIGDVSKISEMLIDEVFALCQVPNPEKSMQDYQRSSLTRLGTIPNYTERLKELQMPVLFINGEKDSLVNVKVATKASRSVKNGQLHMMEGCKHWSQKEKPDEYAAVVDAFINGLYSKSESAVK
jgi:pimeloyl-ACP methyl ester carboxylesterase